MISATEIVFQIVWVFFSPLIFSGLTPDMGDVCNSKIMERITFRIEMPSAGTKQTERWNAGIKAGIAEKKDALLRDV